MKFDRKYFTNKARSIKSERESARQLGGKLQPASGALPVISMKADVKTPEFLVDVKLTKAKHFTFPFCKWEKLSKEAWMNNRRPLFNVKAENVDLVVVDMATWQEMVRKTKKI